MTLRRSSRAPRGPALFRRALFVAVLCFPPRATCFAAAAEGRHGMVATVQPLATEAGVAAPQRRGHAGVAAAGGGPFRTAVRRLAPTRQRAPFQTSSPTGGAV